MNEPAYAGAVPAGSSATNRSHAALNWFMQLRLQVAHRDDDINSPSPNAPVLKTDRSDLELAFPELQDDAVVVVSLRVNDFAQI